MKSWTTILFASAYLWRENFLHNVIESISEISGEDSVIFVTGLNIYGEKVYSYLKLSMPVFFETMRRLEAKDKFDLRDYGQVITAGLEETQYCKDQFELRRTYNMLPFAKK